MRRPYRIYFCFIGAEHHDFQKQRLSRTLLVPSNQPRLLGSLGKAAGSSDSIDSDPVDPCSCNRADLPVFKQRTSGHIRCKSPSEFEVVHVENLSLTHLDYFLLEILVYSRQ